MIRNFLDKSDYFESEEKEINNDFLLIGNDNVFNENDWGSIFLLKVESLEDVESKDLDMEKNKKEELDNSSGVGVLEFEEVVFVCEEISMLIMEEKCILDLKVDL